MQPPSQDLITQFTEDAFAKADMVCQWTRCQASIQKGEPCHYVAAYDPTQPGRFVCRECYKWYKNKPATTARAQNTNSTSSLVFQGFQLKCYQCQCQFLIHAPYTNL